MLDRTPGDPFQQLSPDQPILRDSVQNEYLGGRYKVIQVRHGGMGEVYICEHINKKEHGLVALKTFQKRFFFEQTSREAFAREVSLWARLTGQPWIMPMLELDQLEGRLFAVMPAMEPGPSGAITVRDLLKQGIVSWDRVLTFAFQIAIGMSSAQMRVPGIVHGDLKPENLLLMLDEVLYISDFGLARVTGADVQLESTWAYRAAETWSANAETSPLSDIYSFGVVLYELLTGQTPFRATTREGWRRAHQEVEPYPPGSFLDNGVHGALMSLALRCLKKQPKARPQGFDTVLDELKPLAQQYLPWLLLFLSPLARKVDQMVQQEARVMVIWTLLGVGMSELAMVELGAIPKEELDSRLWRACGVVLSVNNRDEEALAAFEMALTFEVTEEQYINCLSDYGISLRRLGRYKEAEEIFYLLLRRVPDQQVPIIVSNLAIVDLDSGHPERVVSYLRTFLREHPALPDCWDHLGQAYEMLGQYEEAIQCFQRSLALNPNQAQVQVWLAAIYMDQFGQIEKAATALDLALRQGYSSRKCIVRFAACKHLLNQAGNALQLYSHPKVSMNDNEISELVTEILSLVEKLEKVQHTSSQTPTRSEVDKREYPKSQDTASTSPLDGAESLMEVTLPLDGAFTLPFHNIRTYLNSETFSLDFYDDLIDPDYVDHFMDAWQHSRQEIARTTLVSFGFSLKPSSTPFYFTICPGCELTILTNRDHGKRLRCRGCGIEHRTTLVDRDDLTKLLSAILKRLGWDRVDPDPTEHILVLLVQPVDPSQDGKVREICLSAGFIQVNQGNSLAGIVKYEALRREFVDLSQPFSVWQKTSNVVRTGLSPDDTSPEIKQVLHLLQTSVGPTRSISLTSDPRDTSPIGLFSQGKLGELESHLQQKLQVTPNNIGVLLSLALILSHNEEFEGAREKALIAIGLRPNNAWCWKTLGQIEMGCDQFREAAQAFEKATKIDPVDTSSLYCLFLCYQHLGDTHRADEIATLRQSLGNITSSESSLGALLKDYLLSFLELQRHFPQS
jgi:tetratricopeptide (TPR) repeat protein